MSVIQQISLFLVEAVLSLYISAIVIRFLLGYARADFYNPLSQFLVKITDPVLIPVRRLVPAIGRLDTAAVVVALGLVIVKLILLSILLGQGFNLLLLIWVAVGELIRSVIWIYMIALILMCVISWLGSTTNNLALPLINSLATGLLAPVRRRLPSVGILDLSPWVVLLGLNVLLIIVNGIFPSF
ncbi:MAG: hypothetical protein CSB47_08905 [Proteobacteria bacterium]|nr:MAG: hypothetical protein CSB47_08905 [Pseudomonadota bacterium]